MLYMYRSAQFHTETLPSNVSFFISLLSFLLNSGYPPPLLTILGQQQTPSSHKAAILHT